MKKPQKKNKKRPRPFKVNPLDNVSDGPTVTLTHVTFPQDKKPPEPLKPPKNPLGLKVEVPRIQVRVVQQSTEHEGGTDGGAFGDVLLKGNVNNGPGTSRYTIALKLREMADQISNTVGDPMVSASIMVLMSRPRK